MVRSHSAGLNSNKRVLSGRVAIIAAQRCKNLLKRGYNPWAFVRNKAALRVDISPHILQWNKTESRPNEIPFQLISNVPRVLYVSVVLILRQSTFWLPNQHFRKLNHKRRRNFHQENVCNNANCFSDAQSTFTADFGLLLFNIQNKTLSPLLQKQQLRFRSYIFQQPAFVPFITPRCKAFYGRPASPNYPKRPAIKIFLVE